MLELDQHSEKNRYEREKKKFKFKEEVIDILQNHEVSHTNRLDMFTWIKSVCNLLKYEFQTFEITCTIMDLFYFEASKLKRRIYLTQ